MANEITFGYFPSKSLHAIVFKPNGDVRTVRGAMTEHNEGLNSYYRKDDLTIQAGDFVDIDDGVRIVGQGQYQPEVDLDSLHNFDPVNDAVANVTLVDTTTTNTDMIGTDNANTVVPDIAGTAAGLHSTTDSLINALENASPEEIVNALKLSDGWLTDSGSGTLTFKQLMTILTAWAAGKVEDDGSGDYSVLDPEDDTTVIFKLTTVSETSPYKDTNVG